MRQHLRIHLTNELHHDTHDDDETRTGDEQVRALERGEFGEEQRDDGDEAEEGAAGDVEALSEAMVRAAKDLGVMLYVLSNSLNYETAKRAGIPVFGEVFADRGYADDGTLWPRSKPGAMIEDADKAVKQALAMVEDGYVTGVSGKRVAVAADTVCIHGDQPGAAAFASRIREEFSKKGIRIAAP